MKVYLPQKTHRIQFDFVFLFFFLLNINSDFGKEFRMFGRC